jgi:hypothetical protein
MSAATCGTAPDVASGRAFARPLAHPGYGLFSYAIAIRALIAISNGGPQVPQRGERPKNWLDAVGDSAIFIKI